MEMKDLKPGMNWYDFLRLPVPMQSAYIVKMYSHDATLADLARMFHKGTHPFGAHLKRIGLDVSNTPRCSGTAEERRARWDAYCIQTAGRSWPYKPRRKTAAEQEQITPCPNDDDYQPVQQESLFTETTVPEYTITTSVEKHEPRVTTFQSGRLHFKGYADTIARIIEETLPGGNLSVDVVFEVAADGE